MFYIDEDFTNLRKRKNIISEWSQKAVNWMLYWEKLRWLSDRYPLQDGRSCESAVWNSKLSGETMKGQSKIVVQVIFHIDEDFRNSRKQKNTILESNYKAVNCVLYLGTLWWSLERYCLRVGQFHKSTVRISKFFRVFMQDKSTIIFEVMFYINEDFSN